MKPKQTLYNLNHAFFNVFKKFNLKIIFKSFPTAWNGSGAFLKTFSEILWGYLDNTDLDKVQ